MTFGAPLLLLLLLPLAAVFWLTRRRGGLLLSQLPGHWDRMVEPGLRAFLARRIPERGGRQLKLCLAIAALLVLALARPGFEPEEAADYGNLSGRVIVLDLGAGIDIRGQRLFAQRLLEESPGVPAAVVAVAGDAFDIVPLTTDRAQVARYLQVLHPSMMPAPGRALHLGAAHGEAVLERAGVVAGQVVLVTGGAPPRPPRGANGGGRPRVLVALESGTADWGAIAEALGAELTAPSDLASIAQELEAVVGEKLRSGGPAAHRDLTPWLVALVLLLWLTLFRRKAVK